MLVQNVKFYSNHMLVVLLLFVCCLLDGWLVASRCATQKVIMFALITPSSIHVHLEQLITLPFNWFNLKLINISIHSQYGLMHDEHSLSIFIWLNQLIAVFIATIWQNWDINGLLIFFRFSYNINIIVNKIIIDANLIEKSCGEPSIYSLQTTIVNVCRWCFVICRFYCSFIFVGIVKRGRMTIPFSVLV